MSARREWEDVIFQGVHEITCSNSYRKFLMILEWSLQSATLDTAFVTSFQCSATVGRALPGSRS
jgi:hypothetical protein